MTPPITERFTTCPACGGTANLPHVAHRQSKCARCSVDLGRTDSSKKFTNRTWKGLCANCEENTPTNEILILEKEIARNNAEIEALDATERKSESGGDA